MSNRNIRLSDEEQKRQQKTIFINSDLHLKWREAEREIWEALARFVKTTPFKFADKDDLRRELNRLLVARPFLRQTPSQLRDRVVERMAKAVHAGVVALDYKQMPFIFYGGKVLYGELKLKGLDSLPFEAFTRERRYLKRSPARHHGPHHAQGEVEQGYWQTLGNKKPGDKWNGFTKRKLIATAVLDVVLSKAKIFKVAIRPESDKRWRVVLDFLPAETMRQDVQKLKEKRRAARTGPIGTTHLSPLRREELLRQDAIAILHQHFGARLDDPDFLQSKKARVASATLLDGLRQTGKPEYQKARKWLGRDLAKALDGLAARPLFISGRVEWGFAVSALLEALGRTPVREPSAAEKVEALRERLAPLKVEEPEGDMTLRSKTRSFAAGENKENREAGGEEQPRSKAPAPAFVGFGANLRADLAGFEARGRRLSRERRLAE